MPQYQLLKSSTSVVLLKVFQFSNLEILYFLDFVNNQLKIEDF